MKDILRPVLAFTLKAVILLFLIGIFLFAGINLLVKPLMRNMGAQPTFSVDGTVQKNVIPDLAQVNVGAFFNGTNAVQIKKDADTALNTTRAELIALGVAENKIQSNYSITPKYDKDYQNITGYSAHATMTVKTKDFSQVDKVLEAAQKNKLILVDGVTFTLEDPVTAKQQLREAAIKAAKEKAEKMARESGISLGRVINVNEGYTPYYYPYNNGLKANSVMESAPTSPSTSKDSIAINPGETQIQITVTLTYELK